MISSTRKLKNEAGVDVTIEASLRSNSAQIKISGPDSVGTFELTPQEFLALLETMKEIDEKII